MKCQVKSWFYQNEKQQQQNNSPKHWQNPNTKGVFSVPNVFDIYRLLAQLYPVSAGQTTEDFTASDRPDTGALSELRCQRCSAMQIATST